MCVYQNYIKKYSSLIIDVQFNNSYILKGLVGCARELLKKVNFTRLTWEWERERVTYWTRWIKKIFSISIRTTIFTPFLKFMHGEKRELLKAVAKIKIKMYTIHVNEHEVMFNINLIRINLNILCIDRAGRKKVENVKKRWWKARRDFYSPS